MNFSLSKNSIIELLPISENQNSILERVLWVNQPCDAIVLINLQEKKALPNQKCYSEIIASIQSEAAQLRTTDPFAYLRCLPEEYRATHAKRNSKALKIIRPLTQNEPDIYNPKKRSRLIESAIIQHAVTKRYIYHQLRKFWQRGMCQEALLPDFSNCGAANNEKRCRNWDECGEKRLCTSGKRCPIEIKRGRPKKLLLVDTAYKGVNVSAADRKIFKVAIRLYYCKDSKFPLRKAYDEMINKHYTIGEKLQNGKIVPIIAPTYVIPTFNQFRYWHEKEKNLTAEVKAREGLRKLELNCRPLLGNSTQMAFGPGSIFMIDATIGDITLVSRLDRRIIGRPIIYFVVDVFSRMVVGFHICLRGPSWEGAAMAIANAATDKVEFCARYGIPIEEWEWCCHHVSESFIADRGEMISDASESLVTSFNISVANCAPYRPDWKGIVERYFRTTNETILHWLPGDTRKRDFGAPDNRLNATLDIKQLTKLIIFSVLEHNNKHRIANYPMERDMISAGVEPVPTELWQWGIENRVGRLREECRESLICKLLPHTTATVTAHGVRSSLGLHYTLTQATELKWFEHARTSGTWQVDMAINPRGMDEAYLISRNGAITTCSLLPRDERFRGLCYEELEDYNAIQDLKSDMHKDTEQQGRSDTISLSESVINEAQAQTKLALQQNPPPSKLSRLKNIRENRASENELLQLETALQDGITISVKEGPPDPGQQSQEVIPSRQTYTDVLLDKIISTCEVPK